MEELEYITVIEWFCHQLYYNGMLIQARQACEVYPTSDRLKILLSLALALNGKTHESVKESSQLIAQAEEILPALLVQSIAYRLSGNMDRVIVNQIDSKIREERRKASPSSLSIAGLVLILTGKYDKAKEYVDRAYKNNSSDTNVLFAKGWLEVYLPSEINRGNTNYFESILEEDPKHFNALLGSVKYKQYHGDHTGAIFILNSLIVRYPKLCIPLIEKLNNQLAMQEWEQVTETVNRILLIEPNNLDAIKANAIIALCRDGNNIEALKQIQAFLRNLIATESKNVRLFVKNICLFSRVTCKDNQNILTELARVTEKVLQQNSKNGDLMVELANLYIALNRIKDAEQWYRSAIRVDESSFTALKGLAECQLLDNSSDTSMDLAKQQINFLMEIQSNSVNPELLIMSAKLTGTDRSRILQYLNMAASILLKNCENIPYGYEYLERLNPNLCLQIASQCRDFSLRNSAQDAEENVSNNSDESPSLRLLEKLVEACPGLTTASLMLSKAKMENGKLEDALTILKKLLDSVDSTNPQAHLLMAQILTRQGRFQQASQSLEIGLSYNFKIRDDPIYHLITGIVQRENGDLENCVKSYQTALSFTESKINRNSDFTTQISTSDKATLYLELISVYSKLKRFNEALSLMENAMLELAGTNEEGKMMIGYAELYLEKGEIDKAISYLSKVTPEELYYLQAHTQLADIYLKYRKDRQSFAKCYRELVEYCPGPKTYSMLGDAYISIQEPERAIEAYEQALNQNPADRILLANKMGKALIKTHQYTKAISYYKDMIKHDECKVLKLDLADLYMKMKQFDKAEATLVQELQGGRGDSDLQSLIMRSQQLFLLAKVRERAGNIKEALSTLKEAKENQSRYIQRLTMGPIIGNEKQKLADICLTMAEHATSLRDYDQAISLYKDALNHKPGDVKALLSLAKLYMQMNNLERCTQSCTALLTADPNNEAASVMMADIAFRKVDFETAAYHFRQLLMQRPTYWTALARLIEVSRRIGDIDDLEEWLDRAKIAMDVSNVEAGYYYCAGLLHWRTGKLNSALQNFNFARRDPEWGQQAIYNMIEICLDPDDDSTLSSEGLNDDHAEYQDSRSMAINTAYRLLQELNPKGGLQEIFTHRLLGNFFLLATKQKSNIENALQDFTTLASQEAFRDHVGPALGMAAAHILLKQTPRARNHLKRVSRNTWTFEEAEYLEKCWLLLADIYVQSNKYDLANELLKRVLQHNATCVRAHELSGHIAEKDQNYREAALRYNLAWKFGGKSKLSVGYKLAYCCMKAKAYADAIEACTEVLKQNADYPRIRKDILEKCINNLRT